jgi:mono/diheme cytochrome c family protein
MIALVLLAAVSYTREISPLLVKNCGRCHGVRQSVPRGDFSVVTYSDLMEGGGLTQTIVPGDPDRSLLVHFIEGRRGENHRMPLDAPALKQVEIDLIRRWIAEGARSDENNKHRTPKKPANSRRR